MNNSAIQNNTKEPIMQLPIIAIFLAIVAGTMDGYVYYTTKSYATFQSGNIILAGYTFATGNMDKLIPTLCSILSFGIGAIATAIIRNWNNCRNKVFTYTILSIEVIVLIILSLNVVHKLFLPLHIAWILSFLAGMQGNAFHKIDKMLYGNIAVTLNVQLAFNYLAQIFFKSNADKKADMIKKFFDYFLVLVGFALGAAISAILVPHLNSYTLLITAVGTLCIIGVAKQIHKKNPDQPVDSD